MVSLRPLYPVSGGGLVDKSIVVPSLIFLTLSQKYSLNALTSILRSYLHTGACLFNNDIKYLLKFTVIEFKSTKVSFRF